MIKTLSHFRIFQSDGTLHLRGYFDAICMVHVSDFYEEENVLRYGDETPRNDTSEVTGNAEGSFGFVGFTTLSFDVLCALFEALIFFSDYMKNIVVSYACIVLAF